MEQWMSLIQEVGFPIFVSFYLLHRLETKLVAIHDVLVSLKLQRMLSNSYLEKEGMNVY